MISDMIKSQAAGYVICVAAGWVVGLATGLLRSLLNPVMNRIVFCWIYDILVWLGLSVAVVAVSYVCCDGDIRLYIFLGFFSGFLFTYYTIRWVASKIRIYIWGIKNKG